jgi:GNAT superfamily N-acetyltransferase
LYRAASAQWAAAGYQIHAVTLLSSEAAAREAWFWSGFGLTVVDAVRPMDLLGVPTPDGIQVWKAREADVPAVAALETQHWRHYPEAPIFMVPTVPPDPASIAAVIQSERGGYWVAGRDGAILALMRFEPSSEGAAAIVAAEDSIAITAAYVRPDARGLGLAAALLNAGLAHYRRLGFARCTVDFESLNPEASAFWLRYFQPVCLSVTRVPEWVPPTRLP